MQIVYAQAFTTTENLINEFKITENYFSDILNAQLVIFSLIVAAIVALYFLFNWKISKEQIQNAVQKEIKFIKHDIKKEFKEESIQLSENLTRELIKHEDEIGILHGDVYRVLGEFWYSQKNYGVAFIWWIRSAHSFSKVDEKKLTRIALNNAKESIEKTQYAFRLSADWVEEYQLLSAEIDDKIYKIEKDSLDKAIKEVLIQKPQKT